MLSLLVDLFKKTACVIEKLMQSTFSSLPRSLTLLFSIILVGLISACGGGGGGGGGATPTVTATLQDVQIQIEYETLVVGLTSQANAVALYSDNSHLNLSTEATWYSSNSAVASIDANGVITAKGAGTTVISAVVRDKTPSLTVTVEQGSLLSLTITPLTGSLAIAEQHQFIAEAQFGNGTSTYSFDVTELTSWNSSNSKLTISDTAGSKGLGNAVTSGSVTINASLINATLNWNKTDSLLVNISSATLSGLEIINPQTSLPVNAKLQLQANGLYSDGSKADLSSTVSWSSSDASIATIDGNGLISTLKAGNVTFSVSYQGQSATTNISVNSASLTAINVSPINPELISGETLQLYATAEYSDGSSLDITDQATWTSSNTTAATIGNTVSNRGIVSALTVGSSTITAYFNSQSKQATLNVSNAVLQSLEVTPVNSSIAINTQQQFSVTGYYNNGSTRDLSNEVTWSSSELDFAEEQSQAGSFKGIANGTTQIIAELGGVSGFTSLTITTAALTQIDLSPTNPSIANGYSQQFIATGTFNDASTQDISQDVDWSSSNTGVASISNATADKGLLSSVAAGSATITATLGAVDGNANVTVTAAQLDSITIQINSASMNAGTTQTLTATGNFDDATSLDISDRVTWSSSNSSVANISNAEDYKGLVTALSSGSVTITVQLGSVTATTNITVADNPNAPASISFVASPNVILNDGADSSSITITLQPAGNSGSIPNGTAIEIQVTDNGTISNQTIFTNNGSANFPLSSNNPGFIEIQASIAGTGLSLSSNILSTTSFTTVIAREGYEYTIYDGSTLKVGSWFALSVKNISNRDFTIDEYQFRNGAGLPATEDGANINGGQLAGGEGFNLFAYIFADQTDTGMRGDLLFINPVTTPLTFSIFAQFTVP